MADVPLKANLPRKSAFSCEACRKRKVCAILRSTGGELQMRDLVGINEQAHGVPPQFG